MPSLAQKWMSALSVTDDALHVSTVCLIRRVLQLIVSMRHCILSFSFYEAYIIFSRLKLVISLSTNWDFFVTKKKKKKKKPTQTDDEVRQYHRNHPSHDWSVFITFSKEPTIINASFTKCF